MFNRIISKDTLYLSDKREWHFAFLHPGGGLSWPRTCGQWTTTLPLAATTTAAATTTTTTAAGAPRSTSPTTTTTTTAAAGGTIFGARSTICSIHWRRYRSPRRGSTSTTHWAGHPLARPLTRPLAHTPPATPTFPALTLAAQLPGWAQPAAAQQAAPEAGEAAGVQWVSFGKGFYMSPYVIRLAWG